MSEQPAGIGDNGQLRAIVERIEKLEDEKAQICLDIRDIYQEAKGNGFDAGALRDIIKIRKQDRDKRIEREEILSVYLAALGMV